MALSLTELARYSRHLSLREFGAAGQEKLKAARVVVIGAGGLGSPALLYLAAAGVGTVGIVDNDRVDVSNLQRQVLYDSADVGLLKAEVARERLAALNPEIQVVAHALELRAANVMDVLSTYDIVLDGTDRFPTRYLVNDACVLANKVLISAAIHRFEGQAMTYIPGRAPCYRCLFAEPPADGAVPNCAEAGVLGVLPGVLGAIQATEAIKVITGIGEPLSGRLLTYDALTLRFEEFRFARRRDCAVCGDRPTITAPQDPPELCSAAPGIRQLTAQELQSMIAREKPRLIDVREPHEYNAGHLRGATNIPLSTLPQRLGEISPAEFTVFICRVGGRSRSACELAQSRSIERVANLQGGLVAWRQEVEPDLIVA